MHILRSDTLPDREKNLVYLLSKLSAMKDFFDVDGDWCGDIQVAKTLCGGIHPTPSGDRYLPLFEDIPLIRMTNKEIAIFDEERRWRSLMVKGEMDITALSDEELREFFNLAENTAMAYNSTQTTRKVLAVSLYGILGSPTWRYYARPVASDITGECRHAIHIIDEISDKFIKVWFPANAELIQDIKARYGDIVNIDGSLKFPDASFMIYGDTDSAFFNFGGVLRMLGVDIQTADPKRCVDLICQIISGPLNKLINLAMERYNTSRNLTNHYIFEHEQILRKVRIFGKKKYIGSKIWEDGVYKGGKNIQNMDYWRQLENVKASGIEMKQNNFGMAVKGAMLEVYQRLISVDEYPPDVFYNIIWSARCRFEADAMKYLIRGGTVKTFDKVHEVRNGLYYATKGANVFARGVIRYNNEIIKRGLQFKYPLARAGSRIRCYMDKNGDPFGWPVDSADTFPSEFAPEMDTWTMFERMLVAPMRSALRICMPTVNWGGLGSQHYTPSLRIERNVINFSYEEPEYQDDFSELYGDGGL